MSVLRRALLAVLLILLTTACQREGERVADGCSKDTDCKGDRVCVDGECESPRKERATAETAPPAAASVGELHEGVVPIVSSVAAPAASLPNEPPCGSEVDTACSADLFVQLLTVPRNVPDTYDYPDVQKLMRGDRDFAGVRVVEARRNGKRILVAIVRNRCQADRLVAAADKALKSGAGTLCERVDVIRPVFVAR